MKSHITIGLLVLLTLLGCVGNGNVNDTNSMGCNSVDANDVNNPCSNDFDNGPGGIMIPPTIITDPPWPPTTPPNGQGKDDKELTEEEYQALKEKPVTIAACDGLQYETFINAYIQYIPAAAQQGVSYEVMGGVEYREANWCSYNVKNEKEQAKITHYANPYTHEVWQVIQDDGKTAEIHIEHDMMVEVCSDGICQSMTYPGA